jgi:hypothetical protein
LSREILPPAPEELLIKRAQDFYWFRV